MNTSNSTVKNAYDNLVHVLVVVFTQLIRPDLQGTLRWRNIVGFTVTASRVLQLKVSI